MAIKEAVMARYSVATTKNNLSSLIDKALAETNSPPDHGHQQTETQT